MEHAILTLKTKKDQSLRRNHPWVFSGAIKNMQGDPQNGDIVTVQSNRGEFLGMGHYSQGSIAVRIFSFTPIEPDADFWLSKLENAFALRQTIGLVDDPNTNIYRLIHAEGDGLPGLIIDVYGDVAVVQTHSVGMHEMKPEICEALKNLFGDKLSAIYDKSSSTLKKSGFIYEDKYLYGEGSKLGEFLENDVKFKVDWVRGQKTGFFIDQRANRDLLGHYSKGKSVLNTFCYTGGFSLYSLKAGAELVHSLDSSEKAIELVEENVALNNFGGTHESIKADAVEYLKTMTDQYDIIVLDPPAFAKHMSARHQAVQGYKRINAHAMRSIKKGGLLFTFSCSQVVDKSLFNHTIAAAAISVGRSIRVLHQLHQPADHPVSIYHPEGEYLKGLVLQVD